MKFFELEKQNPVYEMKKKWSGTANLKLPSRKMTQEISGRLSWLSI